MTIQKHPAIIRPTDFVLKKRTRVEWEPADTDRLDDLETELRELNKKDKYKHSPIEGFPFAFSWAFMRRTLKVNHIHKASLVERRFVFSSSGESTKRGETLLFDPIVVARLVSKLSYPKDWTRKKYVVTPEEGEQLVRENEALRYGLGITSMLILKAKVSEDWGMIDDAFEVSKDMLEEAVNTDWTTIGEHPMICMGRNLIAKGSAMFDGKNLVMDDHGNLVLKALEGDLNLDFDDSAPRFTEKD